MASLQKSFSSMFGSLPLQRLVSVLGGLGTHQTLFLTNGSTANWRFSCVHDDKCGLPGSRHFSARTSELGFVLRKGPNTTGLSIAWRQRLRSSFYQFLQLQEELEASLPASGAETSPCKQTNWTSYFFLLFFIPIFRWKWEMITTDLGSERLSAGAAGFK